MAKLEKDDIISQQWELIRTMTENNLRNLGNDMWGMPTPKPPKPWPEEPVSNTPAAPVKPEKAAAKPEKKEEEQPPEKIEDLKAELHSYIGLEQVKEEVGDLINLVTVSNLRKQHDLPVEDMSLHLVFTGNPGTG